VLFLVLTTFDDFLTTFDDVLTIVVAGAQRLATVGFVRYQRVIGGYGNGMKGY